MSPVPPATSRIRRSEGGFEGTRPGERVETKWSLKACQTPCAAPREGMKDFGERTSRRGASQKT